MSLIIYDLQNFKKNNVLKIDNCTNSTINIYENEFIYQFFSIGKNSKSKNINKSLEEYLYKYEYVKYCINFSTYIELKPFVKNLDPTEKMLIGYQLGMAVTKFFSNRIFKYKNLYYVSSEKFKTGKGTYDFVSQNTNGYSIFEAKGSTNKNSKNQKALNQLSSPHLVNNQHPIYKIAVLQGFNANNQMTAKIIDPSIDDGDNINIEEKDCEFLKIKLLIENAFKQYETHIKTLRKIQVKYIVVNNVELGLVNPSQLNIDIRHSGEDYFISKDGIYIKKIY
ncbi:MAG: hypothetical protein WCS51_04580 [Bacilli bacterium]